MTFRAPYPVPSPAEGPHDRNLQGCRDTGARFQFPALLSEETVHPPGTARAGGTYGSLQLPGQPVRQYPVSSKDGNDIRSNLFVLGKERLDLVRERRKLTDGLELLLPVFLEKVR